MSVNYGKKFEDKFESQWAECFPRSAIIRLYDPGFGQKGVSNPCDYVCYNYPNLYIIECKTHKGASIPFENIPQYNKLITFIGIPGVRVGVILWLYEKDKVLYIPASTLKELVEQGEKSVGIRHLDKYNIKEIPSTKLRIFMNSDYSILKDLQDGE